MNGVLIQTILDNCPATGQGVDHRRCCMCDYNPNGEKQPKTGWQECRYPGAKREPKPERMEALKAMAGVAHITHCGPLRTGGRFEVKGKPGDNFVTRKRR